MISGANIFKFISLTTTLCLSVKYLNRWDFSIFTILYLTIGKIGWFMNEYQNELRLNDWIENIKLKKISNKINSKIPPYLKFSFSNRFHHLDGIRGLAAIWVVIHHYNSSHYYSKEYNKVKDDPDHLFYYTKQSGIHMVVIFVVLSGYVLSHVYWTPSRSKNLYKLVVGRCIRFYPLHWFTLIFWFYALVYFISDGHRAIYWKDKIGNGLFKCFSLTHMWYNYTDGLGPLLDLCNVPTWSLSTELALNLLMFLCIYSLPVYMSLFVFEIFAHYGYLAIFDHSKTFPFLYYFFIGCIAGKLTRWIKITYIPIRILFDIWAVHELTQFPNAFYVNQILDMENPQTQIKVAHFMVKFMIILQQSFLMTRVFGNFICRHLGRISFALYLMHYPIILLIYGYNNEKFMFSNDSQVMFTVLFSMVVSHFVNIYIEAPWTAKLNGKLKIKEQKIEDYVPIDCDAKK
eukprot:NODE_454_length_7238_cov_0.603306.p2 type:complete len:459 gc:universal NODE_454_length_7238_cov_0.603306:1637-261(-)